VFVSDFGSRIIKKIDEQLNILKTFSSAALQMPWDITAVTDDQILVSTFKNHNIMLLQTPIKTMSTLLEKDDGIVAPYALTYCPDQKKVYVAQNRSDTIKVYQLAYI